MNPFIYHENPSGEEAFIRTGDVYAYDENAKVMVVADSFLRVLTRIKGKYPYDDHSILSAETFCTGFLDSAKRSLANGTYDKSRFREDLIKANRSIKKLNEQFQRDPRDKIHYDIQEAVGMATVEYDGHLYYGGLEDCYVNVLRGEDLRNVAPLDYQITKSFRYLQEKYTQKRMKELLPKEYANDFKPDEYYEYIWCSVLRNNNEVTNDKDEKVGWGCFTGEKEAEKFFQVRKVKLEPGDHILLLTDGMIESISNDEFLKWFLENQENTFIFHKQMRREIMEMFPESREVNKDKTLLYYRYGN